MYNLKFSIILSVEIYACQLLLNQNVLGQGQQTIYIQNISPSEIKDLRKVLSNIGPVRNYLPMLNKVKIYNYTC